MQVFGLSFHGVSHRREFQVWFSEREAAMYPRLAGLIRVMLVVAGNSSLIERAFSFLKAVKTPTRNALSLAQLERLIVLGMNLPDDLDKVDISKILSNM